jgi:SagB-type dehydrogenase family enzyme
MCLPDPPKGLMGLDEAIKGRRSLRHFGPGPITLEETSALLFACQGMTDRRSKGRAAPSAGATYPLEAVLVAGTVESLNAGVYRYTPETQGLSLVLNGDRRAELSRAALGQEVIGRGAAVLVISAIYSRTTGRYGSRGVRYVDMEAGHAAQNVHLMAEALGLGTVVIGAFDDNGVRAVLGLDAEEAPLLLMPMGRAK